MQRDGLGAMKSSKENSLLFANNLEIICPRHLIDLYAKQFVRVSDGVFLASSRGSTSKIQRFLAGRTATAAAENTYNHEHIEYYPSDQLEACVRTVFHLAKTVSSRWQELILSSFPESDPICFVSTECMAIRPKLMLSATIRVWSRTATDHESLLRTYCVETSSESSILVPVVDPRDGIPIGFRSLSPPYDVEAILASFSESDPFC